MVLTLKDIEETKREAIEEADEEEEDPHDHISDLPDDVLTYILSLLHNSREAIETSTLSTRWTHLWKSTNKLYFGDNRNFIDRVLRLRQRTSNIDTLALRFDYNNEDAHHVDSWIHYAVTHNTRVLFMNLAGRGRTMDRARLELNGTKPYELPPYFYSNASGVDLWLKFCKLDFPLPSSSRFGSLLNVHLASVCLGDGAIKSLTSTSPRLRCLTMHNCTWEGSILIDRHPNLEVVFLVKEDGPSGDITIHGPNLKKLILVGTFLTGRCRIKDLSSGAVLGLNFQKMFEAWDGVYNEADTDRLIELLDRLHSIPISIRLCSWCIQALAIRGVMSGGAQGLNIQPLNIVDLELETSLEEWEHPEIAYLLRSCRNLQNLTINIGSKNKYELNANFLEDYEFESWRAKAMSSSCVIKHIKTVKIRSFMRSAYLCAEGEETNDMEVIHNVSIENEIKFIIFLLENLVALEKMTISTIETDFNQLLPKSESLQKFLVILEDFPKVEIIF